MTLELRSRADGTATHLAVVANAPRFGEAQRPLTDTVRELLEQTAEPLTKAAIRASLRVNNNRLGDALLQLERTGVAQRTPAGWLLPEQTTLPIA